MGEGTRCVGALFDLDGVIVDSSWAHREATERLCRKYGLTVSGELFTQRVFGRPNRDWIPELFGSDVHRDRVAQLSEEKEAIFREIIRVPAQLVPGVRALLIELKQRSIRMAIASSAPRANIESVLQKGDLSRFFSVVLDDTSVNAGKPAPDIYLCAAAALGLDPRACVVFEDTLVGIAAARAAGCRVVAVTTTHSRCELADADQVLQDFDGVDVDSLLDLCGPRDPV
jgi:beta-phosphoglucomutase family hydrolase